MTSHRPIGLAVSCLLIFTTLPVILGETPVSADEVATADANEYEWIATNSHKGWKGQNAASPAQLVDVANPRASAIRGLSFTYANNETANQVNAQWTQKLDAMNFSGIEKSKLVLDICVEGIDRLAQQGPQVTLKVGSGPNNCLVFNLSASETSSSARQISEGWNRIELPFDKPNRRLGQVDWSELDTLQLILWKPGAKPSPILTIAGGIRLNHPDLPVQANHRVYFNRDVALFEKGEDVKITTDFRLSKPLEKETEFTISIIDDRQQSISSKSVKVARGEQGFKQEVLAPTLPFGGYRVEITSSDDTVRVMPGRENTFAIDHNLTGFDVPKDDRTFWAMCAHMRNLELNPTAQSMMAELIRRSGARMVRYDMQWNIVEPKKGQWDWEIYDLITNTLARASVIISDRTRTLRNSSHIRRA